MAAGGEAAVEESEVADTPVGRQVVETPGVMDQVVRARQLRPFRRQDKGVPAVEPRFGPRETGPLPGPGDRRRGEVDRVDVEAERCQRVRVAPGAAAQVERAARGDQPRSTYETRLSSGLSTKKGTGFERSP